MARTTITLDNGLMRSIASIAKRENRSTPNFIETILMEHLRNGYYVDDEEQADFDNDSDLQKQIKKNWAAYKKGTGRFV